ncbi:MAG: hypothetical protein ABIP17_08305 [Ilumatobacteraceae bacterium]
MAALIGALAWLGAPAWVAFVPWAAPTAAMVGRALLRPTPAAVTDDDDDSWPGFVIEYALIGEERPRSAVTRVVAGIVFGAPVAWAVALFAILTLAGIA